MIEKIYKNNYMAICDNCGTGQECYNWADVMEFMREEGWRMQAYDKKRKRIVNVEREESGVVIAYSLPEEPGIWYFPLIENGKNVEPYEIMQNEQMSMFGEI